MANTLTNLIPTIYEALDVVSRELVGFIPSVTLDAVAERAAVGQTIRSDVVPAQSAQDVTPATTPPDAGDWTIGSEVLSISKSRSVPIRWTGEEQRSVQAPGVGYNQIRTNQIAQALRTLANEIEVDLATEAKVSASRATGTAGTTPFGSNLGDSAQLKKILGDNGCPLGDRHLVIDTSAGANLNSLAQLTRANEAGTDQQLRQGVLLDLHGFAIRESAGISAHTKGTGTGYLVDLVAGYSAGDTSIHVDTGTGTILAGDVVTFAGDSNKYIVKTGFAGDGDGDIELAEPGLQQSLADGVALTIGNNYTPNVGFHRSALVLLARVPALPEEGDSATDRLVVQDPVSGLPFEFAVYPGYRRVYMEVAAAWGVAGIKREHTAVLLG